MASRPLGVTILAIIQLLGALFYLVSGVLILLVFPLIGIALTAVGVIGMILFYGLWKLKTWAWFWTMIVNILGIIFSLSNVWANIISIVLSAIIVVYLLMPGIKEHFK